VRDLQANLNDAVSKRDALKQEASLTPPVLEYGARGAANDQLAAAQLKLAELRTRLTEQNPDVINARRLVELFSGGNRPAGTPGTGTPQAALPNPLYEQLKVRLVEAEAAVSSLKARLDTARSELGRMEDLARAAPHVQAEYENLDRDYNILRKKLRGAARAARNLSHYRCRG